MEREIEGQTAPFYVRNARSSSSPPSHKADTLPRLAHTAGQCPKTKKHLILGRTSAFVIVIFFLLPLQENIDAMASQFGWLVTYKEGLPFWRHHSPSCMVGVIVLRFLLLSARLY